MTNDYYKTNGFSFCKSNDPYQRFQNVASNGSIIVSNGFKSLVGKESLVRKVPVEMSFVPGSQAPPPKKRSYHFDLTQDDSD